MRPVSFGALLLVCLVTHMRVRRLDQCAGRRRAGRPGAVSTIGLREFGGKLSLQLANVAVDQVLVMKEP